MCASLELGYGVSQDLCRINVFETKQTGSLAAKEMHLSGSSNSNSERI